MEDIECIYVIDFLKMLWGGEIKYSVYRLYKNKKGTAEYQRLLD